MIRKITKVKITDNGKIEASYIEMFDEGKSDEILKKSSSIAHPDFTLAFDKLRIHMATLSEYGQFTEFEENPVNLEIFIVNQISLGGEDEHEGVTLSGNRRLKTNQVLNLNTPFTKFDRNHSEYKYSETLHEDIMNLLSEVDQYLNGKQAPTTQLHLFDGPEEGEEGEEGEQSEIDVEEKPKRGRKKKSFQEHLQENLPEGVTVSIEVNKD